MTLLSSQSRVKLEEQEEEEGEGVGKKPMQELLQLHSSPVSSTTQVGWWVGVAEREGGRGEWEGGREEKRKREIRVGPNSLFYVHVHAHEPVHVVHTYTCIL